MPQGCGCGTGGGAGGSCADVAECVRQMVADSPCLDVVGPDSLVLSIDPASENLARCTEDGLLVEGEIDQTFCSPPDLGEPAWIANSMGPYAPWGAGTYLDMVVDHRLDGIYGYTWPAPDGPFLWGIREPTVTASRHFNINYLERADQNEVDTPGRHYDIESGTWINLVSPAGNATGLMPNSDSEIVRDPDAIDSDNAGWWGWGASPYSPLTLRGALDRLRCRTRIFANVQSSPFYESQAVIAQMFVDQLATNGFSPAVVPCINYSLSDVADVYAAGGMTPAAVISDSYTGPASDLVSAGFGYAIADPDQIDADLMDDLYAQDGLEVLANLSMSRHYMTEEALEAGAAGIITRDPVYARGYNGNSTYYRKPRLHYDYDRTIGSISERGDVDSGYSFLGQPGRILYVPSPTTSATGRQRELTLPLDIDDVTNWQMNWTQSFSEGDLTSQNTQLAGVFFGASTDVTTWPARATEEELPLLNGYLCTVRISAGSNQGNLYIVKYTAGEQSEVLHDGDSIGAQTTIRMGLQVAPSSFSFIHYTSTWGIDTEVQIDDPDYRSDYVWAVVITSEAEDAPLPVRFRNFSLGPPTNNDDGDGGVQVESAPLANTPRWHRSSGRRSLP